MKLLLLVCVLGVPCASPVLHSLKYFETTSSQVPNFPEFVSVGYVDEVQIAHYDSNTQIAKSKQEWMNKDREYWERETELERGNQQANINNLEVLKQRFNRTGGVHMVQKMYGCEWDDETGEVNGFQQYSFDGEDFISLDLKNSRWIAAKQQAEITKHKWDNDQAYMAHWKHYYTVLCPEYLKKYVDYGRSSLMRTELPTVSLLRRTPSSPVTCHATGFYPHRADLFWTKDDEELHQDQVKDQILPNPDGTFQMSVHLDVSNVQAEDWGSYKCVFQLAGVPEDVLQVLDQGEIKTNWKEPAVSTAVMVLLVIAACVLLVLPVVAFFILKKRNGKRSPSPVDHADVQQQMMPKTDA